MTSLKHLGLKPADLPKLRKGDERKAYRDSGGSMKALITSLMTSDAFLYRKVERAGGER